MYKWSSSLKFDPVKRWKFRKLFKYREKISRPRFFNFFELCIIYFLDNTVVWGWIFPRMWRTDFQWIFLGMGREWSVGVLKKGQGKGSSPGGLYIKKVEIIAYRIFAEKRTRNKTHSFKASSTIFRKKKKTIPIFWNGQTLNWPETICKLEESRCVKKLCNWWMDAKWKMHWTS